MQQHFGKIAKISVVLVYLVIIAGTVVRMTGSGMGCPDWPKCFGYYIPPTDSSELEWQSGRAYKKGQVIIRNESLKVAKSDFVAPQRYEASNWAPYTKHDYAIFNPMHTWTEFINRLLGALAGLATLVLAIVSVSFRKKKPAITILSWLVVLAMGFQAWLGATVVYSVLAPVKITVHMVMALAIVALLLYIVHRHNSESPALPSDRKTTVLLLFALGLTLVQIVLGTQVRQFVDERIDLVGEHAKELWLTDPIALFYVHRSFSILIVLANLFLAWRIWHFQLGYHKIYWVLLLIALEIFTGSLMAYVDFPFASQPLHLLWAAILFGVQFHLVLEALKAGKTTRTL
ncbi:MAG: COX15/CtaA family protein [Sediminicola sp.]